MSSLLTVMAHGYFLAALAYNAASQVLLDVTGRKLAPADPVTGILFISVLYLVYLLKPHVSPYPHAVLAGVLLALLLRFGIIQHLLGDAADSYHSRCSWLLAVSINIFGCIVLPFAMFYPGT